MQRQHLISKLLETNNKRKQKAILQKNLSLLDLAFAESLKDTYYDSWTTEPRKTRNAASALEILAGLLPAEETRALASWVRGIADLTEGRLENAVADLDAAAAVFQKIGEEHKAAQTQVAKLIALALLGKYDESVKTGEKALKIFEKYGDELAAGKIEMNLSNIVSRRGEHRKAERYCASALRRFEASGEKTWAIMAQNGLANTYAELNDFRRAENFYTLALSSAAAGKMRVTEAEIEASMGNLALFRGRFDEALRFLELSRRKYEELKMPHQTAIAELEIADIYLELNLTTEALEIYKRVAASLKKQKLQGEEARARANSGRAALLNRQFRKASGEFERAARLYAREKNRHGMANVRLSEAGGELTRGNHEKALRLVLEAEKMLAKTENPRPKLFARWMRGELLGSLGKDKKAEKMLAETYDAACHDEQSNLAQLCLNSLGKLALQNGQKERAKTYFGRAVEMIENLRSPLAAEEFRMSFLADKLAPFESLARIHLSENDFERAFSFIERARARTLAESLNGDFLLSKNGASLELSQKLNDLREELNWFYSRLKHAEGKEFENLQKQARKREKRLAAVMRQIESVRESAGKTAAHRRFSGRDAVRSLRESLGAGRALIEFINFDGEIAAFVVTNDGIEYVAGLCRESEILALLEGLRFQFGALRYGVKNLGSFVGELKTRADSYLQKLYEKLVQPLEKFFGNRDLIIVPVGSLHYVPFHALRSHNKYLIETRAVAYSPSAAVWRFLNEKPPKETKTALLVGFADENTPLVDHEIEALRQIFKAARTLTGEDANFRNYRQNASGCDVLHLACHGQFRPENPLFSSLQLADGFVTVRDICAQPISAALVTLSACETGLNKIYAGDEILGLARGFLAAGADSLVLSLWTVSDEATTELMRDFYNNLQRGASVSESMRKAQVNFIGQDAHPYFWSPFMVIGK